jgi:hypothetical protein
MTTSWVNLSADWYETVIRSRLVRIQAGVRERTDFQPWTHADFVSIV